VSFCVGEWVQVRTESEILATLDGRGCLDGLPFMPQMVDYCGRQFRVSKRAHKLCDTVYGTGARRMTDAVFLDDVRCDGRSYGGCEMECSIFWKEAWLTRVDEGRRASGDPAGGGDGRLIRLAAAAVCRPERQRYASPVYSCQATEMPGATTRMSVWDPRQYVEDWISGNASLSQIVSALFLLAYQTVASAGLGFGSPMRAAYELVQIFRNRRMSYPGRVGRLRRNARTPTVTLELKPGELVRVKDHAEILTTVTEDLVNRGMAFHPEMVPYCAQTFRVAKRVSKVINEKTGQLLELKNPCIVLDGAECKGFFTKPLLCPRGMFPYWREIWLDRVQSTSQEEAHRANHQGGPGGSRRAGIPVRDCESKEIVSPQPDFPGPSRSD
jgi:hypothetical protein